MIDLVQHGCSWCLTVGYPIKYKTISKVVVVFVVLLPSKLKMLNCSVKKLLLTLIGCPTHAGMSKAQRSLLLCLAWYECFFSVLVTFLSLHGCLLSIPVNEVNATKKKTHTLWVLKQKRAIFITILFTTYQPVHLKTGIVSYLLILPKTVEHPDTHFLFFYIHICIQLWAYIFFSGSTIKLQSPSSMPKN